MKKDSLQWMNTRIQLFQEFHALGDVTGEKELTPVAIKAGRNSFLNVYSME